MAQETKDSLKEREEQYQFLALTRAEIPVLYGRNFIVPIHPLVRNLPEETRFTQRYGEEVFDWVWEWTKEDIRQIIDNSGNKDLERLIGYGKEYWRFKGYDVFQGEMVVPCSSWDATVFIYYPKVISVVDEVRFSEEKARAYSDRVARWWEDEKVRFETYFFSPKNVINTVQAFLLRNWCIAYHNRLLKIALGLETSETAPVI